MLMKKKIILEWETLSLQHGDIIVKIQYQMFYEHNLNPMVNSINYIIVKTVWRYLCTDDRTWLYQIYMCGFFIVCWYLCCYWRSNYQEVALTGFIPQPICACPKHESQFATSYATSFCVQWFKKFVLLILVEMLTVIT
jgi:hypothetical protein